MEGASKHSTELLKEPVVASDVWDGIKSVTKAKQFAAIFRPSDDESEIFTEASFNWEESGLWAKLEQHFGTIDQDIRWLIVNLPYTTDSGGQRNKVVFITWVPDTLVRPSMRESVRIKFNGVQHGAPMRKLVSSEGVALYQANDLDDLKLDAVLSKVSRFERDGINMDSLAQLR